MTRTKSSEVLNSNIENTMNDMNNTLSFLYSKQLMYFFNPVTLNKIEDKTTITWHNHQSGRANAGKAFTTLSQYQHILETNSFHGIMFDGSIIRSSFVFKKNKLVKHNHLWWPSPFNFNLYSNNALTPIDLYFDFITSMIASA